jgi:integrase
LHVAEKLSAVRIRKIKNPGRYGDGRGLWLHVGPTGTKSWVFRFTRAGKARELGLGSLSAVSLAEAREAAREARRLVVSGLDPIDVRKANSERPDASILFEDAAEQYITSHQAGWKNEKHRDQWRATLKRYAYPIIGNLTVAQVDTPLVLKIIQPMWTEKPETASRVRQRIEKILDWSKVRGFRKGENPARWKGHLDHLLPAKGKVKRVRHFPAVPYAELPGLIIELRAKEFISARALEFTILNANRTGEVIGAQWPEFNFATKIWTIPAERMKAGKEHRVPLCDRSLEILAALPRGGEFVFPGAKPKKPLSNMAMMELLRNMRPGFTVHGFRSTFRDWADERTNYPREVIETALAHANRDKTEAAYKRGDSIEKRKRLMQHWEGFCKSSGIQTATPLPKSA